MTLATEIICELANRLKQANKAVREALEEIEGVKEGLDAQYRADKEYLDRIWRGQSHAGNNDE